MPRTASASVFVSAYVEPSFSFSFFFKCLSFGKPLCCLYTNSLFFGPGAADYVLRWEHNSDCLLDTWCSGERSLRFKGTVCTYIARVGFSLHFITSLTGFPDDSLLQLESVGSVCRSCPAGVAVVLMQDSCLPRGRRYTEPDNCKMVVKEGTLTWKWKHWQIIFTPGHLHKFMYCCVAAFEIWFWIYFSKSIFFSIHKQDYEPYRHAWLLCFSLFVLIWNASGSRWMSGGSSK